MTPFITFFALHTFSFISNSDKALAVKVTYNFKVAFRVQNRLVLLGKLTKCERCKNYSKNCSGSTLANISLPKTYKLEI